MRTRCSLHERTQIHFAALPPDARTFERVCSAPRRASCRICEPRLPFGRRISNMACHTCIHTCRGFIDKAADPILHASTYEAGAVMRAVQPEAASVPAKKLVKLGYKAQCVPVLQQLQHLIAAWHAAGQSAVVEGVHLNVKPVLLLMKRFPAVLPFLVRCCAGAWFALSEPSSFLCLHVHAC
jgi:hypothetical protein